MSTQVMKYDSDELLSRFSVVSKAPGQDIFKKTLDLLGVLESYGYMACMAGGAVRDFVLDRTLKDMDLVTDMPMDKLMQVFKACHVGKSSRFGLLSLEYLGSRFEVLCLDRIYGQPGGHLAQSCIRFWLEADCRRRDFTINSMVMDRKGRILDPCNGLQDMESKVIRADDPLAKFKRDPARLLRAIRLAAELGFVIEDNTWQAVRKAASAIKQIAPERVGRELVRMCSLTGPVFAGGLKLMDQAGLLGEVLPEIKALEGLEHNPDHHPEGDVLEHTLAALQAGNAPDPVLNLAVLFHDAGKAVSLELRGGRPAYHRHDRAGEEIIRRMGQRLRLSTKLLNTMCFVSANHMKGACINEMRPSKAFRIMSHPDWPVLEAAIKCDKAARSELQARLFMENVKEAQGRLKTWLTMEQGRSRPVISGREVMDYTGLPQGWIIGEIIRQTTAWAMDENVSDPGLIQDYVINLSLTIDHKAPSEESRIKA